MTLITEFNDICKEHLPFHLMCQTNFFQLLELGTLFLK